MLIVLRKIYKKSIDVHTVSEIHSPMLLISILLQSCGNPNWKIADEESLRDIGAKTYHPAKVKRCSKSSAIATAAGVTDGSMEPSRELSNKLPSKCSTEALAAVSNTPIPVPSPAVPTLPQHLHASSPFSRPSTKQEQPISATLPSHQPGHVVLDADPIARRKATQVASTHTPKPAAPLVASSPAEVSQPATQAGILTRKDAALIKATSQPVVSPIPPIGPFVLYPGIEVTFSQIAGRWKAVVKESWGTFSRAMTLPVLCKEDVSGALRKLEGEAALHTQKRIHIL
jgi:hypothetical protein